MEANDYKVDKLALTQSQQIRANEKIQAIESNANTPSITFLKNNYENTKVRNMQNEIEFDILLTTLVLKISVLCGIKECDPFNVADIAKFIKLKCSDLTLEEICKAFELERFSEYEDKTEHFQLFNAAYFSTIIGKYRKWKTRIKFEHNISISEADKTEMSEEEKCKLMADGVLDCFIEWCETDNVPDYRFNVFDILYSCGILPKWDASEQISHLYATKKETAKLELMKEVTIDSLKAVGAEKRKFVNIYENLKKDEGSELENRTKALVLKGYFAKIKETKEHPYKFLQDTLAPKIHLAL